MRLVNLGHSADSGLGAPCYCLDGETSILMADGRTKALAEVRVGDSVYGTLREGSYRRYAVTEVLLHWSTVELAYRVRLEDGTGLIASRHHRFLTRRGWKYVTGRMNGVGRRPYLTTGSELMGTGQFASPPKVSAEYRQGYLCGMVRGDGHIGSYSYPRLGLEGDVHQFRLALTDPEALARTREYLDTFAIHTDQFDFQPATARRREMTAIRTSRRAGVRAIADLIEWQDGQAEDWAKGFLAGVFDAEGSCSRGILRIANTDREFIERTVACFARFGFAVRVEDSGRRNGLSSVRVLGGMGERLRFFHTVEPAITRKRSIEGLAIKNDARLRVTSVDSLHTELPMCDIITVTGDFIANGVVSRSCLGHACASVVNVR